MSETQANAGEPWTPVTVLTGFLGARRTRSATGMNDGVSGGGLQEQRMDRIDALPARPAVPLTVLTQRGETRLVAGRPVLDFLVKAWISLEKGLGCPGIGLGLAWIFLDSLVRIEPFQWVTSGLRSGNIYEAPAAGRRSRRQAFPQWVKRVIVDAVHHRTGGFRKTER